MTSYLGCSYIWNNPREAFQIGDTVSFMKKFYCAYSKLILYPRISTIKGIHIGTARVPAAGSRSTGFVSNFELQRYSDVEFQPLIEKIIIL